MPQATTDQQLTELDEVLDTTSRIVRGVRPEQYSELTPCPGFDVEQLLQHVLTWTSTYADRLSGRDGHGDAPVDVGPEPGDQFDAAAQDIKAGYRAGGKAADDLPIGVLLMDFCAHGWDLASATGQVAPYPDDATRDALEAGRSMLRPEFRGPDKDFGPEVPARADATPLQRLVAFLGRDPRWTRAS